MKTESQTEVERLDNLIEQARKEAKETRALNDSLLFSVATDSALVSIWTDGDLPIEKKRDLDKAITLRAKEVLASILKREEEIEQPVETEVNGQPV